jgi:leucyl/phenylalanyl-tRNA--protein transferase
MPIVEFPDPETDSSPEGIVGIGGDLHPESLELAYRQGIFPWPVHAEGEKQPVLAWFCPPERAVLKLNQLHISRSLRKFLKRTKELRWSTTINKDFSSVIRACASVPRPESKDKRTAAQSSWITPQMIQAYEHFHQLGFAHSVEVWSGLGDLIGGLYGVCVDGVFAGESMFHRVSNASKFAVLHLCEYLKKKGASFIDIQMMTPHMKNLGAVSLSRGEYLALLKKEQSKGLNLF